MREQGPRNIPHTRRGKVAAVLAGVASALVTPACSPHLYGGTALDEYPNAAELYREQGCFNRCHREWDCVRSFGPTESRIEACRERCRQACRRDPNSY